MDKTEYRMIEKLIDRDAETLNDMELHICDIYNEAYWNEKQGLLVLIDGRDVTEDLPEEQRERLVAHLKAEAKIWGIK